MTPHEKIRAYDLTVEYLNDRISQLDKMLASVSAKCEVLTTRLSTERLSCNTILNLLNDKP
jgi:hypothetical protein